MLDILWNVFKTVMTIVGMVVTFLICGRRAKLVKIKRVPYVEVCETCQHQFD